MACLDILLETSAEQPSLNRFDDQTQLTTKSKERKVNPSMVKINEFIYLTFLSKEQITDLQGSCDDGCVVLELEENIVQSECDLLLHKMQHFSKRIRRALEQNPGHQIILCRDRARPMYQEEVVLFLGGFLVLSEHWSA